MWHHFLKAEIDKSSFRYKLISFLFSFADVPDACRFPGAPAHSTVIFSNQSSNETYSIGTVATYICERGFELLGPSRRVCDKSGQWLPEGIPFCGKFKFQICRYCTRYIKSFQTIRAFISRCVLTSSFCVYVGYSSWFKRRNTHAKL